MVDMDFDTLNRGDQVRGFNKKHNRSSSICKSTTVKQGATQGSTFHEHIGKVQTGIRAKQPSHGSCKRPGKSIEKRQEGSHNLNNPQI